MASCSGCRAEVVPDAVFCVKCGKPVSAPGGTKPTTNATTGQILAIIFGVLALIVGGFGLLTDIAGLPDYHGGDSWGGMGVLFTLPCVPFGLLTIATALLKGSPRARWTCVIIGFANLAVFYISYFIVAPLYEARRHSPY